MGKLTKYILYIYAFLISFERIFEEWYNIDTVFKPYRLIAIVFICIAFFTTKNKPILRHPLDGVLYLIFFISLFISLFNYLFGLFNVPIFNNNIIQSSLYILVFFFSRRMNFKRADYKNLIIAFSLGLVLNNLYAMQTFFQDGIAVALFNRVYGFMDNPNFFALGNCALAIFSLFLFKKKHTKRNILATLSLLLAIVFITLSGSRTSFVIIILILACYFILFTTPTKKVILTSSLAILFFLLLNNSGFVNIVSNTSLFWRVTDTTGSGGLSNDVRIPIWKAGIEAGKDTYFIGIGRSQFLNYEIFKKYVSRFDARLGNRGKGLGLHSDYLATLIESGFIAFILYICYYMGTLVFIGFKLLNTKVQDRSAYKMQFLLLVSLILFSIFAVTSLSALYWMILFLAVTTPAKSMEMNENSLVTMK